MTSTSFPIGLALCLVACGAAVPTAPTTPRVVGVQPGPSGQDSTPMSEEDASEWLTACVRGTPQHRAAERALADVNAKVDALDPAGDPKPLFAEIRRLEELPCFAIGDFTDSSSTPDSAFALKTYWHDGGHIALASRLEWGAPGDHTFWFAPSLRRTLTTESSPRHPLAPLLCPTRPGACGSETEGWLLRANRFFEMHASRRHPEPEGVVSHTYAGCIEKARPRGQHAFDEFGSCMQSTRRGRDALPLGKFRAPKDGWLVLRGRRGHHSWCNEIRAYDLATGSAYVTARCDSMFGQTPSSSRREKGRLPLDALREAALLVFLANTSEHSIITQGTGQHIPNEIALRRPKEHGVSIGLGVSEMSSGRTTLLYQWVRGGKSIATGTVEWPDASDAADEHASTLLATAEAGMVTGCAPAPLPRLPHSARSEKSTRVLASDAYFPEYEDPDFDQLERDLASLGATQGRCAP